MKSISVLLLLFMMFIISFKTLALPQIKFLEGRNLFTDTLTRVDSSHKKGLVVLFLSAKCPCSNSHIIEIKDLAKTYQEFNFVAVHSNIDENNELTQNYFKNVALPFPILQDEKSKIANHLQAFKTPHSYIFSSTGEILYQGGVSSSKDLLKADHKFLREALKDIQEEKPVRTPEGRTLGCVILRE